MGNSSCKERNAAWSSCLSSPSASSTRAASEPNNAAVDDRRTRQSDEPYNTFAQDYCSVKRYIQCQQATGPLLDHMERLLTMLLAVDAVETLEPNGLYDTDILNEALRCV